MLGDRVSGFSFIEISIGLCLILLLTTLLTPTVDEMIKQHRQQLLQMQLSQAIHLAREQARLLSQAVTICVVARSSQLHLIMAHTVWMILPLSLQAGWLKWRFYPVYRDCIQVSPTGFLSDNGLIWYCEKGVDFPRFAISVNRAGDMRLIEASHHLIKDSHGRMVRC